MSTPAGPEYSAVYTLQAPSGAIAVFNDSTSPYFVGLLNAETSGLDGAEVRDSFSEIVEGPGATPGVSELGRRPVVLQGTIIASSAKQRNERAEQIKAAAHALHGDATLSWTVAGGTGNFLSLRQQQAVRITKGWVKDFMIPMVANDPRIYSTTLTTVTVEAESASGGGVAFPISWPLSFGAVTYNGQALIENVGTSDSPPVVKIYGAGVNPTLTNVTTGQQIALTYTLGVGEYLEVDFASRRILLNGETNRYSAYNFASSEWWELAPGVNDIRLAYFSYTPGAKMEILYRSAWL